MDITKTSPEDWTFFAKGNANILFKHLGLDPSLKASLLRLRLKKDPETYIPTREVKHFMDAIGNEFFSQERVESKLVCVAPSFLENLNTGGDELMLSERHALLLPNILFGYDHHDQFSKHCTLHIRLNGTGVQSIVFELKPKWLYDNKRNYCRTCLLLQFKGKERHFCPLDLLYSDTVPRGVSDLLSKCPKGTQHLLNQSGFPANEILVKYFQSTDNILLKLKKEQDKLDDGTQLSNITSESQVLDTLALRMTLRDIGVFLVITPSEASSSNFQKVVEVSGYGSFGIQAHIYDLDLKSKSRHTHWSETEKKLESFYDSTNSVWEYCVNPSR